MTQPPWKRPVYIIVTMLTWALASVTLQIYIAVVRDQLTILTPTFWICAALGAGVGFFMGRIWYRLLYVEGRRWHHIHLR